MKKFWATIGVAGYFLTVLAIGGGLSWEAGLAQAAAQPVAPPPAVAQAQAPKAPLEKALAEMSDAFRSAYAAAKTAAIVGPGQLAAMDRVQAAYDTWTKEANATLANARQQSAASAAQVISLTKQLSDRDAEIARLNNALAAEKRAEAIKPNPVLKQHPMSITNDKGVPLMLEPPRTPALQTRPH
jgi:hypothetical protein